MKNPADIHFNIFISLLLEGAGVSLIIIPSHMGIAIDKFPAWSIGVLGIICFAVALCLQIVTVWHLRVARTIFIRLASSILLFLLGWMLWNSMQFIGSGAMLLSGTSQLISVLLWKRRSKQAGYLPLTIAAVGFVTGMYLALSKVEVSNIGSPMVQSLFAAGFLITAFIGASGVIVPSFKYRKLFVQLQMIPWAVWGIWISPFHVDGVFITSTAIVTILLAAEFLPWDRIHVPEGDILSRRVVIIAFALEMSLLIFLGALLFTIDPSLKNNFDSIITIRGGAFLFFVLFSSMIYYVTITIIMTINGLMEELARTGKSAEGMVLAEENQITLWTSRLERYIKPFMLTHEGVRIRLNVQADQLNLLAQQVANEKKRNTQLTLLMELSQQLENQLDQPVSSQLAVNTLERALNCVLAIIFIHEPERKEFMLLAAAGRNTSTIPSGYRQSSNSGVIGRAFRQRKTQIVNDIRQDPDYIKFEGEVSLSALVVPLIFNGHISGMIAVSSDQPNAFTGIDVGVAEAVAAELNRAWERSGYHQRLTELIQTGSQLSSALDPESAAQEVASISRDILQAKFTYIYIQLGQERDFIQDASSGDAPELLDSLRESRVSEEVIKMALNATQPFRVRDVRKYDSTANLSIDNPGLRSMLTIPIRWHHVNIGAIFAFGKQNEVFFTENDESLAELLSIQAGGAFESTWLQQELRSSLRITSLLYRLSNQIIQSENIDDAASDIAQTAHKLARNLTTGIVLLNPEGEIIAEKKIEESGKSNTTEHPMSLIHDVMESGQMIYYSPGQSVLRTCLPIQTPIRRYGALWMDTVDDTLHKPATNPNDLQALVNQAAIALERSLLLVESRRQAAEIKAAYDTLASTYDQTLAALISALDARDRETEGHSMRVSQLATAMGVMRGYSSEQLKVLERGALLHDIGKIGISDTILHKPGPLNEDEWKIMKLHPDIGAKIVEGIPFLQDTIPLIRHHQERWDGSGYPGKLKGEEIPELARLFSVVDAFDALTSNRPYRTKISPEEAIKYLREEAGKLFDPSMVETIEKLAEEKSFALTYVE